MSRARMLAKAGMRRVLTTGSAARRCTCLECAIERTHGEQRAREKRAWRREEEDED